MKMMKIDQDILTNIYEKNSNLDEFNDINCISPTIGESVIVFHEGRQVDAQFVEWENGCAFGFLIDGKFYPNLKHWKYPK